MKHSWKSAVAGVAFGALAACGSSTDVSNFSYGKGNPGANLPEGGDVRIERVYLADGMHNEQADGSGGMTWLQVYQWKSTDDKKTTKKLPPEGTCTDLRTGEYWPNSKLDDPSITDIDLGATVKLTSARGTTELPKCTYDTNVDKLGAKSMCNTTSTPPRALNLMYGGLSAGAPQGDFLNKIPANTVQAGDDFKVDIGKKADSGADLMVHIPAYYKTPLGIGSKEVVVTKNADLELTWTPPDEESTGTEHTPYTHFGRFFVLDTNASSNNGYPLSWVCVPKTDPKTGEEIDGSITVPASVVNQWPATGGLLVHAELTHYMEAVGGRRLDLVGIWCHVSPFTVK